MNTSATPAGATAFTPAVFLALSSGLLGVPLANLQSAVNGLDFNRLFHAVVGETVPHLLAERLVTTFLSASTVREGATEILLDAELGPLGQSIIQLWRTGVWHNPVKPGSPPRVMCDQSYRQTSVCHAAQSHPATDPFYAVGR